MQQNEQREDFAVMGRHGGRVLLVQMLKSHVRVVLVPAFLILIEFPVNMSERQQTMTQVLKNLTPTWDIKIKLWASGFELTQT